MTKTNLQACLAILQALNKKNQLTAEGISSSITMNRKSLSHCLLVLSEQSFLKKKEQQDSETYQITETGKKVLRFFKLDNIVEYKRVPNSSEWSAP